MELIHVEIIGLSTSPSSGGAYALVLREVDGVRRLPIIIGAYEAQAIALELENIQPPRPMTHDLLSQFMSAVEIDVLDIIIHTLKEGTFYAKIRYLHDGQEKYMDARPSDAVAVAVRVNVDIYVSPSVLEEAGIPTEDEGTLEVKESRPRLSPVEQMEQQLSRAIEEENYEEAARLRDALLQMKREQN